MVKLIPSGKFAKSFHRFVASIDAPNRTWKQSRDNWRRTLMHLRSTTSVSNLQKTRRMKRQKKRRQNKKKVMPLALLRETKPPKRRRMLLKQRNVPLLTSKRHSLNGNRLKTDRD